MMYMMSRVKLVMIFSGDGESIFLLSDGVVLNLDNDDIILGQ